MVGHCYSATAGFEIGSRGRRTLSNPLRGELLPRLASALPLATSAVSSETLELSGSLRACPKPTGSACRRAVWVAAGGSVLRSRRRISARIQATSVLVRPERTWRWRADMGRNCRSVWASCKVLGVSSLCIAKAGTSLAGTDSMCLLFSHAGFGIGIYKPPRDALASVIISGTLS